MEPSLAQLEKIKQNLMVQYPGIVLNTGDFEIKISRKTGRIKSITKNGVLLFSLRTHDGNFLPTYNGGEFLIASGYRKNRVYVNDVASPFILEGKSAFCRHITLADEDIYPESIVLLMNNNDELLAIGTAVQPGYAMIDLDSGVAVRTKHKKS